MRKSVLITGAASGLGEALAKALGTQHRVYLHGRNEERLASTAKEIPDASFRLGDLRDEAEPRKIREWVGGAPDILINSAGFLVDGAFTQTSPADFEDCLAVCYLAPVKLIREFLPAMQARGSGIVVNITSGTAFRGLPYAASYSAAKAALQVFSESLRLEVRDSGIRVVSFSPGPIASQFQTHARRIGRPPQAEHGRAPAEVARKLIHVLEHGPDTYVLGWKARAARLLGTLSPRLMDWLVWRTST